MQVIEARLGRSMDEILRDLYLVRGLTLDAIGVELGVTKGAVSRWLERFGIETRRGGKVA